MRYGVGLFPTEPVGRLRDLTQLIERLGYDAVWFGDSQNIWREVSVTMGAAAPATSRITIGSGVTNGVTRHLSVLASTWATLHECAPGRVILGIGTGDSSLRTMGRKPMRLAELERTIRDLRVLFAGGEVLDPRSGKPFHLAYAVPIRVPIYVAASAPKILALAGRVADGVIMLVGTHRRFIEAGLQAIATGAAEVGRSLSDVHIVLWTPTAVDAEETEGAGGARAMVKAHVARIVIRPLPVDLDPRTMADVERIRENYDYYRHMVVTADHASLVPDSLVRHFAVVGSREECRQQLVSIAETGVDEVAIIPYVPVGGDRGVVIAACAPD